MPQLHLYVTEQEARTIRQRAKSRRMPVSRYLAEIVRREVHHGWPDGFFEDVCGGWAGSGIRRPAQLRWEEREPMA